MTKKSAPTTASQLTSVVETKLGWFCKECTVTDLKSGNIEKIPSEGLQLDHQHPPGEALGKSITSIRQFVEPDAWEEIQTAGEYS